MNVATLIGRLTRDPDFRTFQSGAANCNFTVAVNRPRTKDGQQEADFINCVAWNKTAELVSQYLHKGSQVGVQGRIQTRSYQNNESKNVYVTEIIADRVYFLDPKEGRQEQTQTQYGQEYQDAEFGSQMHGNGLRRRDIDTEINPYGADLPF